MTSTATETASADGASRPMFAAASHTAEAAVELGQSARATAHTAARAITAQLAERPYVTLGVVAAAGFVVAGGLAAPAFRSAARLGARLGFAAAARKLEEMLTAVPSASVASSTRAPPNDGTASP